MKFLRTGLIVLSAATTLLAADSPFVGKWKLNPQKSQFAGTTTTFEKLPSGEYQMTADGQSYKFKIDGKEYPAFWGMTAVWKQVDPNSFEVIYKNPGMTTTSNIKISADGKTTTIVTTGKKPNGDPSNESATLQRVSGGPGIVGKWKSTEVKNPTEMWDISANGADGLTFKVADYNAVVSLKFDGKDYPLTGPTVPKNFTMSAQKSGDRTLNITEKMDGKIVYRDVFTLSADGKIMTDAAHAEGVNEPIKAVYDKQ